MHYYLVMLDTTMASAATPIKGFRKGIQNVYIVLASDERNARTQVLMTFKPDMALINAFIPHTHVVSLEQITGLLTTRQALWSYIPMGGMRAVGQQKRIPTPESLLDPKALDITNPNPLTGDPIPDIRNQPYQKGQVAHPVGRQGGLAVKPIAAPIVYDEQVKRDEAYAKTTPADPLLSLLGDPAQMARLQALLGALNGGQGVPVNLTNLPKKVQEDPREVAMRFTDDAPYDDSLTAIPSGPLPQVDEISENIPGLVQPDNEALARLRSNLKTVRLEDIPGQ